MNIIVRYGNSDEGATAQAEETVTHIEVYDVPRYAVGATEDGPSRFQIRAFSPSKWAALANGDPEAQLPDLASVWFSGPAPFVWDNVIFPADALGEDPANWTLLLFQADYYGDEIGYYDDEEWIHNEVFGLQPNGRQWTFAARPAARTWT